MLIDVFVCRYLAMVNVHVSQDGTGQSDAHAGERFHAARTFTSNRDVTVKNVPEPQRIRLMKAVRMH